MNHFGFPELMIVMLLSLAAWVIPIAAGVWVLVTLNRIRANQQAIMAKLDAIERLALRS